MLVLTRRDGEILFIGNNIKITIIRISRGLVKVGIDAPLEYIISRDAPPTENTNPPTEERP